MEPVRGGRLCKLADSQNARLKALAPTRTLPEWAFRFIQGIDGVTVTLSGMSNMEQLTENVKTFSEFKPLTDEESRVLAVIADEMIASKTLPCTSCRYCTEKCPSGLNIPRLIELFNETSSTGITVTAEKIIKDDPEIGHPESCIACGACEQVCPQGIKISNMMQKFVKRLSED
jgi:predicted aldo/keto reductase-like oxidoreductase